jgi:molecular chaperone DnaK
MRKAAEQLSQASHKLAEAMYAKASAQQQTAQEQTTNNSATDGSGGDGGKKKDDVVDADFTEVKE